MCLDVLWSFTLTHCTLPEKGKPGALKLPSRVLQDIEELRGVARPEDQRRPKPQRDVAAAGALHAAAAERRHQPVPRLLRREVDRAVRPDPPGAGERVRAILLQLLESREEVLPRDPRVLEQPVLLDRVKERLELHHLRGVSHPRVEDAVPLRGAELGPSVVPPRLHLLAERYDVRRILQAPPLVRPECPRAPPARLDLVDDERDAAPRRDVPQLAEEVVGRVVVPPLGLDGLDDDRGHVGPVRRRVAVGDRPLREVEAPRLLLGVLGRVPVEGVRRPREVHRGPVERRYVHLVYRLAVRGRHTSQETAVERAVERQDGEVRGARRPVRHAAVHILGARGTSPPLPGLVPDERGLEGVLVRAAPAHHRVGVREAGGGEAHEGRLDPARPVVRGEHAEARALEEEGQVGRVGHGRVHGRVVVPDGKGGDLAEDVEVPVAVDVDQVVPPGSPVVREEVHGLRLRHLVHPVPERGRPRAGNLGRPHVSAVVLARKRRRGRPRQTAAAAGVRG
mmetsp:Transcript_25415/g.57321  ORF Transcript_25415/g.57321 Transcript_25415/m.57321 type:complete len:509 (+) Transcript_25415:128-1654(+)